MDDNLYITENPEMQAGVTWDNFLRALTDKRAYVPYPHPITLYSHGLDCTLYGLHAGGHHITSLITHILASILLFLFLRAYPAVCGPVRWWQPFLPFTQCMWSRWRGYPSAKM